MTKSQKFLIISYFIVFILPAICMYPYEVLKCWPAFLFVIIVGLIIFIVRKYPEQTVKLLINKVTLFPIQIIAAIFMVTPVILFYFMYFRLWGFLWDGFWTAILKCFWIIK